MLIKELRSEVPSASDSLCGARYCALICSRVLSPKNMCGVERCFLVPACCTDSTPAAEAHDDNTSVAQVVRRCVSTEVRGSNPSGNTI